MFKYILPAGFVVVALLFLGMVMGVSAYHYGVFPGSALRDAFSGLDAVMEQNRQLSFTYNRGGAEKSTRTEIGVLRWDANQALNGYTLVSSAQGQEVLLLDMEGNTTHSWQLDYLDIWHDRDQVKKPVPDDFIFVRNARLMPDGGLLLSFSAWATTPHGYGIVRVDKDSNVLWANFRHIHHSFDIQEDGTIVALDYQIETKPPSYMKEWPVPHLGDGLSFYSADGELIKRQALLDSFAESPFRVVLEAIALKHGGDGLGDFLHSNDVEILRPELADIFPMAEAGDLLISLRSLDGIAILDAETLQVKWFRRAYWRKQHDPDFLPNGNMLIFDNIALELSETGMRRSRVIEFDPKTMEIIWMYAGSSDEPFFSGSRSSQQRLVNGNTLITESNKGRIIEVKKSGEIVWEYINPQRVGKNNARIPALFWATRYTEEEIRAIR